ncbi:hypothetical protein [Paraburkholderia aromaticivorans]|uniref:Transmembrane protein n=1 Tax=Paraburkholderia aromaticivorans TaxID=2026199 RepID=A0A248VNU7_9BURK|nr:hypothetical protein [Paraburkholderia aromaticivorans]ASW00704.1 hypothetical protein CJU94_20840 [Paraburkholderia aromaticivorans]
MSKLTSTIKHEFMEMLPPTLYFFVILHIVTIMRALITRGYDVTLPTTVSVTIAALILGKSVLIANMLPFINHFPQKPLIWNIGWKTVIYTVVALIVHYLERLYEYWKEAPSVAAANRMLLADINWPHFWAIQILLVTLIAIYCLVAELVRVIGRDKFMAMFFGSAPPKSTGQPAG